MPRRAARSLPALLLLAAPGLLAACSDAARPLAPTPHAAAAAIVRGTPIHGHGHLAGTQQRILLSPSPLVFRTEQTADGYLTPFGAVSAIWAVPQVQVDLGRREATLLTPTWTLTMIFANGDQLFARYTFRSTRLAYAPSGAYTGAADMVLTGGTGRFAGVTGHALAIVRGSAFSEHFTIDLEGVGLLAPTR